MVASVEEGERVVSVERCGGGVAAATDAIILESADGAERPLILKRYPAGDETPELEWERLGCAARAAVPTPERIAVDQAGEWFGTPALLMTTLPGQVEMRPSDLDAWTRELADGLAAIHRTDLGDAVPSVVLRLHGWTRWQLWDVEVDSRIAAATAAIERLQRKASAEPVVFCHDDYHPGNVLFEGGRLTGIIDWSSARLAPACVDVAHARADLAIAPGADAPDRFLVHYSAASGESLAKLALWDVFQAMRALQWSEFWLDAFADVGVVLRPENVRASVEQFLDGALARCAEL